MTNPHAGRRGTRWRRLHANIKAHHHPCWLCGQPIDYTLDWPHPHSFSVDHALPLGTHPHLAEDPTNLRASHLGCNSSRGNRTPRPQVGTTSRVW